MNAAQIDNSKLLNILLVEDDDIDAMAVRRAFDKVKIANPILRAIDGVEALGMLRGVNGHTKTGPSTVLFVDINMPRMNGIDFVKTLRSDSNLKHSIVFILTTSKSDEDKVAAYNLNVAGYIVKERAGQDFLKLINMIDHYWRIIELP